MTVRLAPWVLVCLLFITGCAGLRSSAPPLPTDWEVRTQTLLEVQVWEMRGRIAVRDTSGEGGQAGLLWKQRERESELRLNGPLGSGSYELHVAPERITVTDAAGKRSLEYSGAAAAEIFMTEEFGWAFPVASSRYWMLGLLDPAAAGSEEFGGDGQLLAIRQHGWHIRYQRFAEFDGSWLPTRLELENERVRLRIVVQRWLLQPDAG